MQKTGLTRRQLFPLLAVSWACLALAAPGALAREVQYDENRRHYRIRNLDPKAVDEPDQRLFMADEYSIRAGKELLDGQTVLMVEREERNSEGDQVEYKFYADPWNGKTLRLERRLISRHGKQVEHLDQNFANHFLEYGPNTFHIGMFPFVAQTIDLGQGAETELRMLSSPEYHPVGIILTVDGEDSVTVPAGTFECIRIIMRYKKDDLPGFLKKLPSFLIDALLPEISLWVEKGELHAIIKIQGKLEGFAAPEKVHELIRVDRSSPD
jgi:hypothetical protein